MHWYSIGLPARKFGAIIGILKARPSARQCWLTSGVPVRRYCNTGPTLCAGVHPAGREAMVFTMLVWWWLSAGFPSAGARIMPMVVQCLPIASRFGRQRTGSRVVR